MSQTVFCIGLTLAMLMAPDAFGQTPASSTTPSAAPLVFEVATIKPVEPGRNSNGLTIKTGKFEAYGFTIKDLISYAYTLNHEQIVEGPKWADSEKYDIVGKPEAGPLVIEDAKEMVQGLLADRFAFKFHYGAKEMPVYVLTIARGGSKLKVRTDPDEPRGISAQGPGNWHARATLLSFMMFFLQSRGVLDRPVLDQTGLKGRYDFDLRWSADPGQSHDRALNDPDAPDLFTAFQEQLGLKLEAKKAPAPVIVVDNAEKPSDN